MRAITIISTCWDDKNAQDASTKDCQAAIEAILKDQDHNAGLSGRTDGCVEIASSGGCAVSLCDVSSGDGVVTYGAIAMAGQVIHAVCKGNPSTKSTGGFNTVAGMGIPGVKSIVGTVELGKKDFVNRGLTKRREGLLKIRSLEGKEGKGMVGRAEPDEKISVPGTNHRLVRLYAQQFPDFDGEDLGIEQQRTLRDRLVSFWNNSPETTGSVPTVVAAFVDIGTTRYTLEYTAYNNADLNRVGEDNRSTMIDQFFLLRSRNDHAPIFHARVEVDDGTPLGTLQLVQANTVAFEQDPFEDSPSPPSDDDPFRDPPDNPNGTNPFANPFTVLHIEGCY